MKSLRRVGSASTMGRTEERMEEERSVTRLQICCWRGRVLRSALGRARGARVLNRPEIGSGIAGERWICADGFEVRDRRPREAPKKRGTRRGLVRRRASSSAGGRSCTRDGSSPSR
ncbi:putative basic proline-rich protein-like [Iris pallida]|uniref:Basic proline-rich protein-like n=1 Tax=Iris pallida TaxID=29817 RepID=A0AAX6DZD0_IRIPA|nr:putative basic proline-rich protein-like [Iris pallida]